ncbi:helix-turn-helix domain-containing protein [Streptomyces sp. NPDC088925]|uniref:helix-turn-helix domain-containing protein n=1 Tax=Streptomyces sp. NPDC088925 TaxID=3365914 RepID=UPI00380DAA59
MHQPPTTFHVDGAVIRRRRMAAGVGLPDLAKRAGISRRYLSHIENGTRSHMGPALYLRLRTALGATENELLVTEESPKE